MSIVLDAMGGDHAPDEVVRGALEALPHLHHPLLLVGQPERVLSLLPASHPSGLEVIPATEVVDMHDVPTDAIRKKKDSSIAVGVQLVKDGKAKAFVSAGNTGACSASSLLSWRQVAGIHRPAIGTAIPSIKDPFLLLDAGASPDVDPVHLLEFAIMGRSYAQNMWNRSNPKVHLLNIGEEPGKGNLFAKETYKLLAQHSWFAGNIESKQMYSGECDVVVCDAFVGNIVLKCAEGTAELIMKMIRDAVPKSFPAKLAYLPLRGLMQPLRKKMDYAEVGGSPLLGLNGLCFIAHGRSNSRAIKNALLQAQTAIDVGLVDKIRDSVTQELTQ